MGQARLRLSWELFRQSLDLPHGWRPKTIYLEECPTLRDGMNVEPSWTINVIVEGYSIEEQPEDSAPLELEAHFKVKFIDGDDGRWIQGHWELYR